MSKIFDITWVNVQSALVYVVLTLLATFALSAAESVFKMGSIFGIDWHQVVNGGVMAVLPVLIGFLSLLKNFLTTKKGNFVGVVPVIPHTDY